MFFFLLFICTPTISHSEYYKPSNQVYTILYGEPVTLNYYDVNLINAILSFINDTVYDVAVYYNSTYYIIYSGFILNFKNMSLDILHNVYNGTFKLTVHLYDGSIYNYYWHFKLLKEVSDPFIYYFSQNCYFQFYCLGDGNVTWIFNGKQVSTENPLLIKAGPFDFEDRLVCLLSNQVSYKFAYLDFNKLDTTCIFTDDNVLMISVIVSSTLLIVIFTLLIIWFFLEVIFVFLNNNKMCSFVESPTHFINFPVVRNYKLLQSLRKLQALFGGKIQQALHVSLVMLEIDDGDYELVREVLAEIIGDYSFSEMPIYLTNPHFFGRYFVLDVIGLRDLYNVILLKLRNKGIKCGMKRPWIPHLTLAQFDKGDKCIGIEFHEILEPHYFDSLELVKIGSPKVDNRYKSIFSLAI
uniref:ORF2 protein n=1 Tax=Pika coronavirus TaxID=3027598 RepID=A0AAT9T9R4_9NIDO|nr:MAG: ORF2 protein [Pika coronavirus]WCZ56016.1 MAG: ORF2 protein [Pika coronavirus]